MKYFLIGLASGVIMMMCTIGGAVGLAELHLYYSHRVPTVSGYDEDKCLCIKGGKCSCEKCDCGPDCTCKKCPGKPGR